MNARQAAFDALLGFLRTPKPIDYEKINRSGGAEATRRTKQVLRHQSALDACIKKFSKTRFDKLNHQVLTCLRLGLADLIINQTPEYAAVSEAANQMRRRGPEHLVRFVNGVLRSALRGDVSFTMLADEPLAVKHSHPQWMIDVWKNQFGEKQTIEICNANNQDSAALSLRTNQLKTNRDQLASDLQPWCQQIEHGKLSQCALYCFDPSALADPPADKLWRDGNFYIQNEAAQVPALILNPQAGATVVDLCCAPGGKTTHLAELVGTRGRVIAVDNARERLGLVNENAKRLGHDHIETMQHDLTSDLPTQTMTNANFVMIDAPCSGLGILKKAPEAKWLRDQASIKRSAKIQQSILASTLPALAKGCRITYSVCTHTHEETYSMVAWIAENFPNIRQIDVSSLDYMQLPSSVIRDKCFLSIQDTHLDGHFTALFEKM